MAMAMATRTEKETEKMRTPNIHRDDEEKLKKSKKNRMKKG